MFDRWDPCRGSAPGVCTVDANQSGSTEYLAAPEVQQSFLITVCGGTVTRCITSDAADQVRAGLFFLFTLTTTGSPTPKLKATGTLPKGVKFHRERESPLSRARPPRNWPLLPIT